MTQPPPGYTVAEMPSGAWYVEYTNDGVQASDGPYNNHGAAVMVAWIYYERERAK